MHNLSTVITSSTLHLQAVMHYGETFKALLNEECGDGIESAIDFFADFQVIEGKAGEKRVCLVLNGKVGCTCCLVGGSCRLSMQVHSCSGQAARSFCLAQLSCS